MENTEGNGGPQADDGGEQQLFAHCLLVSVLIKLSQVLHTLFINSGAHQATQVLRTLFINSGAHQATQVLHTLSIKRGVHQAEASFGNYT